MKVQSAHRSPAHCRGMVFCLPPHSLNYFALCSGQLLCPATETFNLEHQVKPRRVLFHPFFHPTWLLLKRSLADSLPPLRCDRWQAPVKTSYLRRAPSTVGPFCPPAALPHHPPFPPVPTIPVHLTCGNHASALSSSWSQALSPSSLPLVNYAHDNPDPIIRIWGSLKLSSGIQI